MEDITLKIEKMKCQGCVEAMRTALEALDPKCIVSADAPGKLLNVRLSTLVPEASILSTLESIGYPANLVKK